MLQVVISPESALTIAGAVVGSAIAVVMTGWRTMWYLKKTFLLMEKRLERLEEEQREDRSRIAVLEEKRAAVAVSS